MTSRIAAACAVAAFIVGLLLAGIAQAWRYDARISGLKTEHATELKRISDEASRQRDQALADLQAAQSKAAAIDNQRTQELADAQAQNETLRAQYAGASADAADARRRLRIQAKCPASGGNVPAPTSAGRVGDETSVELSAAAGSAVFDLRRSIIEDQKQLLYLQDYVNRVCPMGEAQ